MPVLQHNNYLAQGFKTSFTVVNGYCSFAWRISCSFEDV